MKKNYLGLAFLSSGLFFAQIGINIAQPTATLDVNGNVKVRDIAISNNTDDITLVADQTGIIKKRITDSKGLLKGYLSADFEAGKISDDIFKVTKIKIIDDPGNNFNSNTGVFMAPVDGLYKITMTLTSTYTTGPGNPSGTANVNYAVGLGKVINNDNKWINRFSIPKDYIQHTTAGSTNTFIGLVELKAGSECFFAISGFLKLLVNPTGDTGSGIGNYFEIQLVKNT